MKLVRRTVALLTLTLALAIGISTISATPALASAETCTLAPDGTMCNNVIGDGNYVQRIKSSRIKFMAPYLICNYNAWYFYVPPSGGAFGLGTESRSGCGVENVWLTKEVNRSFPHGTLVCSKFYENGWNDFIGEKCVGLS